ncbi:MAG TPA: carboxypeptidase regulatory-like domain-containing protein [Pyrinomonadaceae bacterium]|nr:carboxypeptidase regulatory-like domain-containing protein [Pyrinomonadaceae bacterium]
MYRRTLTHLILRTLVAVICVAMFATVFSAMAQTSGSGTLRGTVKDPQGAIVRGATVTLTNAGTKDERQTTTNDDGGYVFAAITPGEYVLKVEAQGFKTTEKTKLAIETAATRSADVQLEVGQPTEIVTVTAGLDQVQTETGAKENTITASQIDNLSIVSRSAVELLRILPGVVAPDASTLEQVGFVSGANSTSQYHVNGLRGEQNNVQIDGARMIDFGANNGSAITANPDMIQEVRVQTSNYAAEHGTSAVQISATTKGGSHDFHGSVYDYIRHNKFQANDRSNTINGIVRPLSKYNYPGGNIGGPILFPGTKLNRNRDKLFFFFGYEKYYQQVDEGSSLFTVPTLKERAGDFTGDNVVYPKGCIINGIDVGGQPTNSLTACKSNLGAALLNLYPVPNRTGGQNYVYSVLRPNNRDQYNVRVDYNISDKTKLYVKFAREYEEQGFPRGLWWDSSNFEVPGKLTSYNTGKSFVANLTSIVSPTMTNEVLFAASKLNLYYTYADPDKVSYQGLGLAAADRAGFKGQASSTVCNNCSGVDFVGANPFVPIGVTNDWWSGVFINAYGFPIYSPYSSFSATDNLSMVKGPHTLKFGAYIEQANKNQQSNHDTNILVGGFDCGGRTAENPWGFCANPNGTAHNFGDLYTGRPSSFTQATDRPADAFRLYNYEFYAQDSWKVRPNVTLETGLRFGYFPQNYEQHGLGVLFDPASYDRSQGIFIGKDRTKPNGFKLASRGEIPKGVLPNPSLALMPRVNVAWDIGGKGDLVIRAGAGMFFNRVQGNYDYYSSGQMPNTYSASINRADFPGIMTLSNLNTIDPFKFANVNVSSRDVQSNDLPRTANFSLTIEKRLPGSNIFSVAYVGTQGRHLPQQRSVNIIPLGRLSSGTVNGVDLSIPANRSGLASSVLSQFRPFPAYNTVGFYQFTGTSSYHSLQATLSHQSGKNLQYFATYTFAKALGTVATNETDGSAWADPIDTRGRSWGILPFDRTHVFNLSYNYTLPKLARGSWENKFTRGVFNGWQLSGITTFQTGIPIRLRFSGAINSGQSGLAWFGTDAFNIQGQSVGAVAPVYLRNPSSGGSKLGDKYFDLSALAIPKFPNTGPAQPPFYLRAPSRSNFDVSVFKNFNFDETKKLQFRAGFFNVFNQAYPSQIATAGGFGASDIYLTLNTTCNQSITVPNGTGGTTSVCDPTQGYSFDQSTLDNFGKVTNKHGRRIVEFAFKFYF